MNPEPKHQGGLENKRNVRVLHREHAQAVGVQLDITELKQREAPLPQAQKMEAIGQLAGGIAHDFNNLLTVINGNASLMLDAGGLSEKQTKSLKQIYTAGECAASLTRQLLVFSGKQAFYRQPIDLNKTITEAARFLGRLVGEDIKLELNLALGLPPINADASMLEQVLTNLALNARDAMPKGGQLTIMTKSVRLDEAEAAQFPGRRPGDFVSLSVCDTGCGIPPDVLPRIFEPFFTTKEFGAGAGLGLATTFGIVQHHEGWLEVHTHAGEGTCFTVFLPPTAEPMVTREESAQPSGRHGAKETILLVEDETALRDFTVAALEHFGYRVLQAASGVQALEVWKWHNSRIVLLLTDLVMPNGINGVDLAKTLQAQKPELKVVFTSGYSRQMTTEVFALRNEIPFLQKPYVPATLARVVREALDKNNDPAPPHFNARDSSQLGSASLLS